MSDSMRELLNEEIRWGSHPESEITSRHRDHSPYLNSFCFSSYTAWGVLCIEHAFLNRMRAPQEGDSKRAIKRDIQTNPHLHPHLRNQLLQRLRRSRIRFDWLKRLDSFYCQKIQAVEPGQAIEPLATQILEDTNLPKRYQENLLYNLVSR